MRPNLGLTTSFWQASSRAKCLPRFLKLYQISWSNCQVRKGLLDIWPKFVLVFDKIRANAVRGSSTCFLKGPVWSRWSDSVKFQKKLDVFAATSADHIHRMTTEQKLGGHKKFLCIPCHLQLSWARATTTIGYQNKKVEKTFNERIVCFVPDRARRAA